MTSVCLFYPVKITIFQTVIIKQSCTVLVRWGDVGFRVFFGGWRLLRAPAGSYPFQPSVQKHAQQVNQRSCYLSFLQLFHTPVSLQMGACSCTAAVDGGPVCVFVSFTFCDHLLLSHANTKPTPKPCHLA